MFCACSTWLIVFFAIVAGAAADGPVPGERAGGGGAVAPSLRLVVPQADYEAGAALDARLILRNPSHHEVSLVYHDEVTAAFAFSFEKTAGGEVAPTAHRRALTERGGNGFGAAAITVAPGEEASFPIRLNRHFDLSEATEKYSVRVSVTVNVGERSEVLQSPRVSVRVVEPARTPVDPDTPDDSTR